MVGCLRRGVCDEQKWSKGKMREKVANKVLFDEDLHTRLEAEIPKVRGRGCFHMPCVMSAASAHMEKLGGGVDTLAGGRVGDMGALLGFSPMLAMLIIRFDC
jgi:hypothetical protein